MPTNIGFLSVLGAKLETTFNTAIAVDRAFYAISDSLINTPTLTFSPGLVGYGAQHRTVRGPSQRQGAMTVLHDLGANNPFLRQAFGAYTAAEPGPDPPAAPAFYSIVDLADGIGLTVAIREQLGVREHTGLKISQLQMTGSPGDGCRLVASTTFYRGYSLTSTVNTPAILDALALPDPELVFDEVDIQIGDLTDPLAAGDSKDVMSYTLTFNRNLEQRVANSLVPYEAKENDKRTVQLVIGVPYYDTKQWHDWRDTQTPLQGKIIWASGGASQTLLLPSMSVAAIANDTIANAGAPSPEITLNIYADFNQLNSNAEMAFGAATKREFQLQEVPAP
jgi:hypothetical protein